jgi:phage tail sheath protein FI
MSSVHNSAGVYVTEDDRSLRAANAPTSIGAIVGDSLKGPVGVPTLITDTTNFINIFGKPDPSISFMHHSALAFLEESNRLYVVRIAPGATYSGATVSSVNNNNVIAPWVAPSTLKDPTLYSFSPNDLFIVTAANQGAWGSKISVDIYPNTNASDSSFAVDVYLQNVNKPIEKFIVTLNYELNGFGSQRNIEEFINKNSKYINITQNFENPDFKITPNRKFINTLTHVTLVGGVDGALATPGQIIQGWDLFSDPEQSDINILINGGYAHPAVQSAMTVLCEKRMDCIAVLDTPSNDQSVANALAYRRTTLQVDSSYAALYSPDYFILDKYSDRRLYVPPSGFVAAAYARTDNDFETWFAPAGVNRGKLNVLGVRYQYVQGDRDALVESQINPTRVIPGSGIRIWGADTLQSQASALSNVSVRRLMIFLEKSLSIAALYSVFDPNDEILRAQMVEICERFLKPIKDGRGLYSYGVICDDTNNPPEVTANGDLMLDVEIDPVLPAKRVLLTAIITKTGAVFSLS